MGVLPRALPFSDLDDTSRGGYRRAEGLRKELYEIDEVFAASCGFTDQVNGRDALGYYGMSYRDFIRQLVSSHYWTLTESSYMFRYHYPGAYPCPRAEKVSNVCRPRRVFFEMNSLGVRCHHHAGPCTPEPGHTNYNYRLLAGKSAAGVDDNDQPLRLLGVFSA